jgi:hypothetical protein
MKLGTHNSATGNGLIWWQKPLGFIIHPFSTCQSRSIRQQLEDGVKVFNLQVAYVNGQWRFTHGLAIYNGDLMETIRLMRLYSTEEEPIYFQLYLDKMLGSKSVEKLLELLNDKQFTDLCDNRLVLLSSWIEGTDIYPSKSNKKLSMEEHYWTMTWAKSFSYRFIDKLPLPKYHANRFNSTYKVSCNKDYLMLDYYQLG